ncbi:hypothetical protein HYPSUDRAFT_51955 [Hypholoma sublateritium FD-334 SS-4]|uniref:Uncharacterized protein n=1 Tax=Hypholoma sublateritium (strain FD-334 SS-4) TaxID=945553 RepID=A0A0D2MTT6_HYPSF|nr:hypothetical protein HYPSUDRAFT_51955 [Hypholoma sublateritium FD-334 SS-4]
MSGDGNAKLDRRSSWQSYGIVLFAIQPLFIRGFDCAFKAASLISSIIPFPAPSPCFSFQATGACSSVAPTDPCFGFSATAIFWIIGLSCAIRVGFSAASEADTHPVSYSLATLFKQDAHPDARQKADLVTLNRDRSTKPNIAAFSGLSPNPDRLVQPEFLSDLPAGADGIWQILDVLCDEGKKEFANAVLSGVVTLSPTALSNLVMSKMSRNADFMALYIAHSDKPIVAFLVNRMLKAGVFRTPSPDANGNLPDLLQCWDFQTSSIALNALASLFRQDLLTFMELYTKNFTTRIRYEAAVLAVDCECMGKALLEGEATGMLHKYSSSRRSAVAEETIRKIYPVGASKAAKLRAKRRLFLSGCILPMANCIVGELGKLNIGLGMVGTVSSGPADIPPLIFPLAAMLIRAELLVVKAGEGQPNGRSGYFKGFGGFPKSDRDAYEELEEDWNLLYLNPDNQDRDIDRMVETLGKEQNIAGAVQGYISAQAALKQAAAVPPSRHNEDPPSYEPSTPYASIFGVTGHFVE